MTPQNKNGQLIEHDSRSSDNTPKMTMQNGAI